MTTSNITNTANEDSGFKALVGTAVISVLLPLGLVLGVIAMNAPSAEAGYTQCHRIDNTVACNSF